MASRDPIYDKPAIKSKARKTKPPKATKRKEAVMPAKKKKATKATKKKPVVKMALEVTGGAKLEGRKDKVFQVALKRGDTAIPLGDFLAKTAAEAKRKAGTVVRRQIGAC